MKLDVNSTESVINKYINKIRKRTQQNGSYSLALNRNPVMQESRYEYTIPINTRKRKRKLEESIKVTFLYTPLHTYCTIVHIGVAVELTMLYNFELSGIFREKVLSFLKYSNELYHRKINEDLLDLIAKKKEKENKAITT
ncbi:hypothetical protein KKF82_05390 [Patescibacteria group bacterium]|nr:hypothetical protein [Patescibacteria group bacterium]